MFYCKFMPYTFAQSELQTTILKAEVDNYTEIKSQNVKYIASIISQLNLNRVNYFTFSYKRNLYLISPSVFTSSSISSDLKCNSHLA